jgi:hypothetical protein
MRLAMTKEKMYALIQKLQQRSSHCTVGAAAPTNRPNLPAQYCARHKWHYVFLTDESGVGLHILNQQPTFSM